MGDNRHLDTELSRDLTLFQITMMGLGMMIGAGVFLGIGNAIFVSGPGGVILTFSLNTLLALFTAMSYGELSSAIPRAGGAYNFARIGFGRGTSFLAGWMEWFASSVAGSMYAITFSIYTTRYLDQLELLSWLPPSLEGFAVKLFAIIVAVIFLLINYRGASETGKIGAIMTLGQTLFLIAIGLIGIYVIFKDPQRLQNFTPFLPYGWSRLLITMGFTYVAFEGFEVIAQAGDETIEPRKNLPKAMLLSVFIAGITYVAVSFATVVAVKAGSTGVEGAPWEWIGSFRERGFGEAVGRLLPMGNFLLTLAVIFASTSALNATIFSATRASYALGRDKMLPAIFSRISTKRKTPYGALILTGVIILIVAAFLPTMDVASSASIMFLFLFFLVNLCVIKIRLTMGDELSYGFVMPFFPLFPILALIAQAVLAVWLIHMSLIAWIIAPLWILSGLLIYFFYAKDRAIPTEDEIIVLEENRAPEGDEYRIMVPVANPKNALNLIRNTIKISERRKSRIKLLHMVSVPNLMGLADMNESMLTGKEGIIEAMLYLKPRFPITTTIRYCRNIGRGIISAVKEKKIDLLIMGWHGKKQEHFFHFGSTLDPVIARAPCNVVILKNCENKNFDSIAVPVYGDKSDLLPLEIAASLIEKPGGIIKLILLKDVSRNGEQERNYKQHLTDLGISAENIEFSNIEIKNSADSIKSLQEENDLVIINIINGRRKKISTYPFDNIISRTDKPVVMIREGRRFGTFTKTIH